MKNQPPQTMTPYELLCEAIEDFISSAYQLATPESIPPMIAALAEIRAAVEAGIDNLLDTGQLTSKGFSTIWMMGAAHEWLDVLRAWEEVHFEPQLELEAERLAAAEAEHSEASGAKVVRSVGASKAIKRRTAGRATAKKSGSKKPEKK